MLLILFQAKHQKQSNDHRLASSMVTVKDASNSIESLAKSLNLVIPASVKQCQKKGEQLSQRGQQDVINSLIILQAAVGRDRPLQSEYELCSQTLSNWFQSWKTLSCHFIELPSSHGWVHLFEVWHFQFIFGISNDVHVHKIYCPRRVLAQRPKAEEAP